MSLFSSRRGFLATSGAATVGASLFSGCSTTTSTITTLAKIPARKAGAKPLINFAATPLKDGVKVGVIGLGMRGPGAVQRLSAIPFAQVVAVCDIFKGRADNGVRIAKQSGKPAPTAYFGDTNAWKKLVDDPAVNLVYITSPWQMHVEMCLYAMSKGKHVACEVPMCFTIEESWQIVDMAEKMQVHCMLLENCCYGQSEMLALNMTRNGVLGTLVHGEGAYIHDLRSLEFNANGYEGYWRLKWNKQHNGNPYATHGLGPICQYMNINAGDRMTHISAMNSAGFGRQEYIDAHKEQIAKMKANAKGDKYGMTDKDALTGPWAKGDMSTAIIRSEKGRTIMVQHDVTSPRPYSRINLISGTKGILKDYPLDIALEPNAHGWLNKKAKDALVAKWNHPLWKESGEIAKKMGGHGGMDFLMDLRLCYCLKNGLPLDINVYDSVLWSSIAELTEVSANANGASVEVPDYTRGAYKMIKPIKVDEQTVKVNFAAPQKTDPSIQLNV